MWIIQHVMTTKQSDWSILHLKCAQISMTAHLAAADLITLNITPPLRNEVIRPGPGQLLRLSNVSKTNVI